MPVLAAEGAPGLRLGLELHGAVPAAAQPLHGPDPCLCGWLLHPGLGLLQVAVPRPPKGLPCTCHQHLLQGSHPPLPALLRVTPLGVVSHHAAEPLTPHAEWHLQPRLAGRCGPLWLHPLPLHVRHGQAMTEPALREVWERRLCWSQLVGGPQCLWGLSICHRSQASP